MNLLPRLDVATAPRAGIAPPALSRRVDVVERTHDGFPVVELRPPAPLIPRDGAEERLLYLHGATDAPGAHAVHWNFLVRLAERTGRTVTVPLYPSAAATGSGQTVSAPAVDSDRAVSAPATDSDRTVLMSLVLLYDELTRLTGDPASVSVMGDEAGASMAADLVDAAAAGGADRAQLILLTADDAGVDDLAAEFGQDVSVHGHDGLFHERRFIPALAARHTMDDIVATLGPVPAVF